MWAAILNIFMGLFVMIAPGLFNFDHSVANQFYIVGPVVITFSVITLWEVNHGAHYLNIPAAAWLLIAPLIIHSFSATATWLAIGCGVAIILLSLVKRKMKGQYGGGWTSLFQKHPAHMRRS